MDRVASGFGFGRHEGIEDRTFCEAVEHIAKGLRDADAMIQRIACPGRAKSGFTRAILGASTKASSISLSLVREERPGKPGQSELSAVRTLANEVPRLDEADLDAMRVNGTASELICDA